MNSDSDDCKHEREGSALFPCRYCIRLRSSAKFDNERDQVASDYFKIADARISALQMQVRKLKESEKERMGEISSLTNIIINKDKEIERLRSKAAYSTSTPPGTVNMGNKDNDNDFRLQAQLKSYQIQIDILRKRNDTLERKLRTAILQEHEDIMAGRVRTLEEQIKLRGLESRKSLDVDNAENVPPIPAATTQSLDADNVENAPSIPAATTESLGVDNVETDPSIPATIATQPLDVDEDIEKIEDDPSTPTQPKLQWD